MAKEVPCFECEKMETCNSPCELLNQPKLDRVLGDTVLAKEQIAKSLGVSITGVLNMDLKLAKDADAHTRSEVGRFLENNNVISLMPGQKSNLGLMLTAEVYQRLIKELEGE